MTLKYRAKPVEIEAWQWDGRPLSANIGLPQWIIDANLHGKIRICDYKDVRELKIETLEGTMTMTVGDWVVRGTENELYPCKASVFKTKYEAIHA